MDVRSVMLHAAETWAFNEGGYTEPSTALWPCNDPLDW